MDKNIHTRIKALLEETNDAFINCAGSLNSDYAAFASMRLSEFKNVLKNPDLTDRELRKILRKAGRKHPVKDPEGSWASFMASYVAKNANQNLKKTVSYGLDKVYEEKS